MLMVDARNPTLRLPSRLIYTLPHSSTPSPSPRPSASADPLSRLPSLAKTHVAHHADARLVVGAVPAARPRDKYRIPNACTPKKGSLGLRLGVPGNASSYYFLPNRARPDLATRRDEHAHEREKKTLAIKTQKRAACKDSNKKKHNRAYPPLGPKN
ncbi:hypothetical protein BU16DRAFT_114653 [Lophium mytilinum]|uniref:Uncharacterized protein n=1 Tax=Lophium mytilinum TaxID=390894 RepID=A0A6A6QJQ9_9PEZI|nr:hypothetical protein BU16DRAFT_114653 [Lophium mytilinum]